jgi:hypothetical protein
MGTAASKEEGIVTVAASRERSTTSAPAAADSDPLLQHLRALRAQVPSVESALDKLEPESVWKDMEAVKDLRLDPCPLRSAIQGTLTSFQAMYTEQAAALTTNQEYIHRLMDSAESKAARCTTHLSQQSVRLKAITNSLSPAMQLPALLQQLVDDTTRLEQQLQQLQQIADQRAFSPTPAAKAAPPAAAAAAAPSAPP